MCHKFIDLLDQAARHTLVVARCIGTGLSTVSGQVKAEAKVREWRVGEAQSWWKTSLTSLVTFLCVTTHATEGRFRRGAIVFTKQFQSGARRLVGVVLGITTEQSSTGEYYECDEQEDGRNLGRHGLLHHYETDGTLFAFF